VRKGAKFETVLKNIKELVTARNSSKNSLKHIGLLTTISKLNVQELPLILQLAGELGVDGLSVNGCGVYNEEVLGSELFARTRENVNSEYEKILCDLREDAVKRNIKLRLPSLWAIPYNSCEINRCVVSWNGNVAPCPLLSYERPYWYFGEKLTHPAIIFGNINDTDLLEIWESSRFKDFRNDLRTGKLPGYCQKCLMQHKVLCG
jgi:radical SAM protein with 4Fe4S-binding SPASM domain